MLQQVVALLARNHVEVGMHDDLTGGRTDVLEDVHCISVDCGLHCARNARKDGAEMACDIFGKFGKVGEADDFGDHESVARSAGKSVEKSKYMGIFINFVARKLST